MPDQTYDEASVKEGYNRAIEDVMAERGFDSDFIDPEIHEKYKAWKATPVAGGDEPATETEA